MRKIISITKSPPGTPNRITPRWARELAKSSMVLSFEYPNKGVGKVYNPII